MIKVNVEQMIIDCGFNTEEAEIVRLCFKGKKNEAIKELRKSKPKIVESIYEHNGRKFRKSEYTSGMAAYTWRMLAFYTCNSHPYCCMPVMADFDLPYTTHEENYQDKRKVLTDKCQVIIDKILEYIPKNDWKGIIRWGNALGAI
jgi:hypothetical protein